MAGAGPRATRLLFVGNSFTARNGLPHVLVDLAAAAADPLDVEVESIIAGGASLRRHWNAGVAQRALEASRFDWVVLQEQSTLPIKNAQRYHENVRLFAPLVAAHGAWLALYLTWSRAHAPDTQALLDDAVEAIGAELAARVVPVGRVWHDALEDDPPIALYMPDGSHPNATGSYLAACTFLVTLLGRAPNGFAVSDALGIERGVAARVHAHARNQPMAKAEAPSAAR
jgi:hypothetical protein